VKRIEKYTVQIAAIVAIAGFAFWLALVARESTFIQETASSYGYVGILLISFASGFNLLVPIPAISFPPLYIETGLNPIVTVGLITIGMTAADSVAYLLGRLGRDVAKEMEQNRVVKFFDKIQVQHKAASLIAIFLYAALAPLPNEILAIPLGFMRFRFIVLLPILLVGNLAFNTLGAFGIVSIFNALM